METSNPNLCSDDFCTGPNLQNLEDKGIIYIKSTNEKRIPTSVAAKNTIGLLTSLDLSQNASRPNTLTFKSPNQKIINTINQKIENLEQSENLKISN